MGSPYNRYALGPESKAPEDDGFDLRKTMRQREMELDEDPDENRVAALQDRLISLQAAQNKNHSWAMGRDGITIREGDGVDRSSYIDDISKTLEKIKRKKKNTELNYPDPLAPLN